MQILQEKCILKKNKVKRGSLKMSIIFSFFIFNSLEMLYLTETILQKLHSFLNVAISPVLFIYLKEKRKSFSCMFSCAVMLLVVYFLSA